MKRVFILVPDLQETSIIAHELTEAGVKEGDIHVCAHINQDVRDAHLHPTNVLQETHVTYAIKYGPIIGLCFVALIYALCKFLFPPSVQIHWLGYAAMLFFGIGFGVWASGLAGLGMKDEVVEKYENYVNEGHFLMMVDMHPEKQEALTRDILAHHPGTKLVEQPVH